MENATKALLIAASVLIAIVLIAVGIRILGSTNGVTNEVEKVSGAVGVSVFNSQFTDYTGIQSSAEVKALLSKVVATYRDSDSRNVSVTVSGGDGLSNGTYDTANEISTIISDLKINSKYKIGVSYDNAGYVSSIGISAP